MDQAAQLRNVIKMRSQAEEAAKARVFTITSGKGGVGKSNVAVNLAIQFRKLGKRVVIFDADLGLANVEVMFGSIPKYNLSDLIYRGKTMKEIITPGPLDIGFISGGSGIMALNNLSRDQIMYLVRSLSELDQIADVVLIDTGAGISDSVMEFVLASAEILLVATPEPSSLTDSYSLLKALFRNPNFPQNEAEIYVIANKVLSNEDAEAVYEKLDSVVHQFLNADIRYLGMIPQDTLLEKAVRQQKTVSLLYPEAQSTKAFEVLAKNLLNHEQKEYVMKRGFLQMLAGLVGKA